MVVLFYIPAGSIESSSWFTSLPTPEMPTIFNDRRSNKCYLILVLIFIPLMINNIEHFSCAYLPSCMFFSKRLLQIICQLILSDWCFIAKFWVEFLSHMWFTNTFSQSMAWLFILYSKFQKEGLINVDKFLFSPLMDCAFSDISNKLLSNTKRFASMFCFRV